MVSLSTENVHVVWQSGAIGAVLGLLQSSSSLPSAVLNETFSLLSQLCKHSLSILELKLLLQMARKELMNETNEENHCNRLLAVVEDSMINDGFNYEPYAYFCFTKAEDVKKLCFTLSSSEKFEKKFHFFRPL